MSKDQSNPLIDCGKPLFFKVANADVLGFEMPAIRLGEAVRLSVRSLSVMQKEALVASVSTGNVWRLASDEGAYLAGLDEAPCPLSFLSTGMVCSYMNEIQALAKIKNIAINDIRLIQDNYYTMKGSARDGSMTGGAKNVDLTVQIDSDTDQDELNRLVLDATAASPLNGLMRGAKESLFTLTHNDNEIDTAKALPIGSPALPDPGAQFEQSQPTDGDWSGLIKRGGMTPKAEHSTTLANDSLADQQNRLLHVRVICTVREDGVKEVTQHLFNPHGSVFTFLCDEAEVNGGKGMAPDAASYISAGIGFCFMTQFGRYAKIVKKELQEYKIVQDTHFSLGGASGGTGKAGSADPVETHVFLKTNEEDEFAQTSLDMSEQTCFLHAFCKADLKTRVKILSMTDEVAVPEVAVE
jgi:hypothetical protein